MRKSVLVGAMLVLSVSLPVHGQQASDSRDAFERLKDLVGTWNVRGEGRTSTGTATYRLTGGGRVLMEDMGGMSTAYYMDGDRLVMTHFCGAGNQPRMRMTAVDDEQISFVMFDITNLASPDSYHSTELDVEFIDDDRVRLAYSGMTAGRRSTQVFALTRR